MTFLNGPDPDISHEGGSYGRRHDEHSFATATTCPGSPGLGHARDWEPGAAGVLVPARTEDPFYGDGLVRLDGPVRL